MEHKTSRLDAPQASSEKPTLAELQGDSPFAQVARKHWLGTSTTVKVKQDVVKKDLWDVLESGGFQSRDLLILENLQLVEKYLWPDYTDDASNFHVLLLALIITVKHREHLLSWELLVDQPSEFSSFFRRLLSLALDKTLAARIRTHVLVAIRSAFQSLDSGLVRKECAPLVSIPVWHNLHNDAARERLFEEHAPFKKAWRQAAKRYEAADEPTRAKLRFERSWLFSLIIDFFDILYDPTRQDAESSVYCERILEFLTDLQSQFPTRRYVNTLLQDLNVLTAVKLSPLFQEGDGLFRDLYTLLRHFTSFPLDDRSGQQQSVDEIAQKHSALLANLQRVALKHFKEKLSLLALSNFGSLEKRAELEAHLENLTDEELNRLCTLLGYRVEYPKCALVTERRFVLEVFQSAYEKRSTYQEVMRDMSITPTESSLYEESLLRNELYDGTRSLAIPKLNLQYLSTGDFLWRSFILYRCESFYEIRKDMESIVKRLQSASTGSSRMALRIPNPAIIEVLPPKVGEQNPSQVRAEILLDVSRLDDHIRREWESLRPTDVIFLLNIGRKDAVNTSRLLTNGHAESLTSEKKFECLRVAEVIQVLDEKGRSLRAHSNQTNGYNSRPRQRRLLVKLDPVAYQQDVSNQEKGKADVYESINLVVRRRSRENNFKAILENIQGLALSDTLVTLPSWFQDIFLGLGDPAGATYKRLPNALKEIDYRDTFLNWQHLKDSLPDKAVETSKEEDNLSLQPPYVLRTSSKVQPEPPRTSRKRKHGESETGSSNEVVKVSTYQPPNTGPYPSDAPKLNRVRYTPAQIEAITSGTQPGLTVIVGPPGTGKTDVATQIINNIYHNFPNERTLLVAHSNQALNQLFQKIVALDIDERHLLRLGHGEGELQLDNDASYSKHGRIESLLETAASLLAEVSRLAASISAPGAHGNSCETAEYFNSVYVQPTWAKYSVGSLGKPDASVEEIAGEFPFHNFFSTAPQPLFPDVITSDGARAVANGCYRHIEKVFAQLSDIRPFEVLRNDRTKQNYLLVKEARIIAMTSTHAAMRRDEIANLGFRYDNVVMEEAAQITEVENFIPLALQKPRNGAETGLKRVVLCGDHLQNSPIVQNLAFKQYANLEQSLFLRLVRLGVPQIILDQQGRARPSLASLYKWRYPYLSNLPVVTTRSEFLTANAGFRYDYQFIDVPDYKGRGETEPTPHFLQNLGEAEYAVALFMYMRLLGYPASKVSILTTYAGQRALIRDVLTHRCAKNRLFGLPRTVTTVDQYQGEQNDYVILSLVRTSRAGYLRSLRRITVALSRARLGLYILGRAALFQSTLELHEPFAPFWQRPVKLALATGEMYPAERLVDADVTGEGKAEAEMDGVEHLGQYVFEMTGAKVRLLREGGASLLGAGEERVDGGDGEAGDGLGREDDDGHGVDEDGLDEMEPDGEAE